MQINSNEISIMPNLCENDNCVDLMDTKFNGTVEQLYLLTIFYKFMARLYR